MARNPAVLVSLIADWDGRDLDRAMKEIEKVKRQTETATQRFNDFGRRMQSVGDTASRIGGRLTKTVTLPIVGAGGVAAKMAMDFDDSMTKIVSLVGLSRDEVEGMKSDVLALSGETAKSPQELAEALFVVTSAGVRGTEAIEVLAGAAKAGAAGLGETADIARSVSGVLAAYGSETISAARATDIITATARAGNFETSQFAGALGKVLPFAQQAGGSLEDVGGATALLTRINGDASRSVNQVSRVFGSFVAPTARSEKMLASVGLTAQDVRDSIGERGLVATLRDLDDRFDGNREMLAKVLRGSEAQSAAFSILDADADTIAETFGVVTDSLDMTNDAFDVTSQTTGFQMRQAFQDLKNTLIDFGEIIMPFVQMLAERIKGIAEAFQGLSPEMKELIVRALGVAAAIGPVLLIGGKLISAIGGIIAIANPLTLKIAAIIAIAALLALAFKFVWDNSETLRNVVQSVWETIQRVIQRVVDRVRSVLDENRQTLDTLRDAFMRVVQFIVDHVVPAVATFYGTYLKILIEVIGFVIEAIIEVIAFWVRLITKLVEVGAAIATFVSEATTIISGWVEGIKKTFENAFGAVRDFIGGVFESIYTSITTTIRDAVNFVIRAINRVIGAWNGLSFSIPSVTVPFVGTFGGQSISVPTLPKIPEMADGGIVRKATLAIIGEAGPEAVVPLSRKRNASDVLGGSSITINVTAGIGTDGAEVGRQIVDALKAYERRNGSVYVSA